MAAIKCLVTGATGYVGGRLIPELLTAGHEVRVMVRHPERLRDFPWIDQVEVAVADAGDQEAVERALEGMDVAYYLMHSLGTGPDFEATETRIAQAFAAAAEATHLGRIIYLGDTTSHSVFSASMPPRF